MKVDFPDALGAQLRAWAQAPAPAPAPPPEPHVLDALRAWVQAHTPATTPEPPSAEPPLLTELRRRAAPLVMHVYPDAEEDEDGAVVHNGYLHVCSALTCDRVLSGVAPALLPLTGALGSACLEVDERRRATLRFGAQWILTTPAAVHELREQIREYVQGIPVILELQSCVDLRDELITASTRWQRIVAELCDPPKNEEDRG